MNPELEHVGAACDKFFDDWAAFKERVGAYGRHARLTTWHKVMFGLTFRIVDNLRSSQILVLDGRHAGGAIMIRAIYEAYLSLLVIGFHSGEIHKDYLHSSELAGDKSRRPDRVAQRHRKRLSPTRDQLASRFLRFGDFAHVGRIDHLDNSGQFQLPGPDEVQRSPDGEMIRDYYQRRGQRAARVYGFGTQKNRWDPFRNVHLMSKYIWPPGGAPIFPLEVFPTTAGLYTDPEALWRDVFEYCYRVPSHFAHPSAYGVFYRPDRADRIGPLIDDSPAWDPSLLLMALELSRNAVRAFALAIGASDHFRLAFESK